MINKDATIDIAYQISDRCNISLRDAMSIAVESALYMDTQRTPATEGLGKSLSLGARILTAVKRAIDFIIRIIREMIAKFSKDANKKSDALKKIARGVSGDIYKSAKAIHKDARDILTKCVTYADMLKNEASKIHTAIRSNRDADLRIPDSKIDPEGLSTLSTKVKERADALSDHSKKMMERYAYQDMHIDFATTRTLNNGQMYDLSLLMLIPDQLTADFVSELNKLQMSVESTKTFIDDIYKYCENAQMVKSDDRSAIEGWAAKISKRINFIHTSLANIKNAMSVQIRIPFTQ